MEAAGNPQWTGVVRDGLSWLLAVSEQRIPPEEARRRLTDLQESHPAMDIDLVWEQEDYSGTVHYDLLIRPDERGTISLSYCADRAVPWPLRNAFRAPDGWVAKINGRVIDVQTAMTTLDVVWGETRLVERLVNGALIDEAATRRGLRVSDACLQQAMNGFRRNRRLLTRADTLRYLEAHGMTQRDLEFRLEAQALEDKLREAIARDRIEPYFEEHRAEFATAHVARFRVADEVGAQQIAGEIAAGGDFFAAAQAQFLAGNRSEPLFAVLRRGSLSAEQARAIFADSPGATVILPAAEGFDAVRVLRIDQPALDEATRELVAHALFEEWLAEQRSRAQILWFWGDPDRLENQNAGWPQAKTTA